MKLSSGAGFIVVYTGDIMTMPGLPKQPAAFAIDVDNDGNITQVAHLCGFRESLYFSRMFKKKYGVSPSFYYAERVRSLKPHPDSDSMKIMMDSPDE